jgi:hypothetical protein
MSLSPFGPLISSLDPMICSTCSANPFRLQPRPGKVADLGWMPVDDPLILCGRVVYGAQQEVDPTQRAVGPPILPVARVVD